jgi:hypothetical protein
MKIEYNIFNVILFIYCVKKNNEIKAMNKKNYKLNSNWVTGFVDAEGCFYVRVSKSKKHKTG